MIVPTLLRGNASTDAPRSALKGTRSIPGCIPTQSVGTINQRTPKKPVGASLLAKAVVQLERSRLIHRLREQARSHIWMRCTPLPASQFPCNSPCKASARSCSKSVLPLRPSALDVYLSSETHRYLSSLTGVQIHQHRFNHSITRPECTPMFAICPAPARPSGFHYSVGLERRHTTPQCFCRGLA